jgi:hypothetical protein
MKKQKLEEEEIEEFKKYVVSNLRNESKDVDFITEFEESKEEIEEKMKKVSAIMKESKYITFLTGAGISVNSGLPDYRGTKGVWTKRYSY